MTFDLVLQLTSCVQVKRLKELRGMLMERDPCVAVTIRKLAMVSLMEVFKDIAPGYRIRPLTSAEAAVKVTGPFCEVTGHLAATLTLAPPKGQEANAAAARV